ncbi:MAG: hypothetical protein JSU69_01135 [Candidatus Zixiibacteriota bacterium]|nr:MAG: hypothetical protein JSU69_01135 [candidate division Zixibacteria bacterium]
MKARLIFVKGANIVRKGNKILTWTVIILALAFSCPAFASWENLGLHDIRVWTVSLCEGRLYAGTEDGIYWLDLTGPEAYWTPIGLQGQTVRALLILSVDTILAGLTSGETSIYRTTDGGENWEPFQNGYGGGEFHPVYAFDRMPGQSDTIFATGNAVVARSIDGGLSWQEVWGGWEWMAMGVVFVRVDPNFDSVVWAGGEAAIFAPWLLKSTDGGESWDFLDIYGGGDNRCHDIAVYPGNSERAWVSMEGRVRVTNDGGESWSDVLVNEYYLYGIEIDSLRPSLLYVSAAQHARPLTLFTSRDMGFTWSEIHDSTFEVNGALDILLLSHPDRNEIYFATTSGVFCILTVLTIFAGMPTAAGPSISWMPPV